MSTAPASTRTRTGNTVDRVNWRNIAITLIFRLLTDAPDATRTESNRNLSEMAWFQQLLFSQSFTFPDSS
jgi:hypothetical protein